MFSVCVALRCLLALQGKEEGEIHVRLSLHTCNETADGEIASEARLDTMRAMTGIASGEKTLASMIGQKIFVKVAVDSCMGLPSKTSTNVFVSFKWFKDEGALAVLVSAVLLACLLACCRRYRWRQVELAV